MFRLFKHIDKNSSDEELMIAASKGNKFAFECLYEKYYNKLVNFCKQLLYNDFLLAEDITQEVFLKIIKQPELFDTSKKFSTWMYTIAKNLCFNHLRNEQNRKLLLEKNYQSSNCFQPHSTIDAEQLEIKIDTIFKTLSDKEKTIFVLRFEQELSIKEISEITQMPEGSIKSGIFYLLKKLSVQLKEYTNA